MVPLAGYAPAADHYQLYGIDFLSISGCNKTMFERQETRRKVGKFQQYSVKALFQTITKVWCKSGVKLKVVQEGPGYFTPKPSIFVGIPNIFSTIFSSIFSPISILLLHALGKGEKKIGFFHGAPDYIKKEGLWSSSSN